MYVPPLDSVFFHLLNLADIGYGSAKLYLTAYISFGVITFSVITCSYLSLYITLFSV